MTLKLNKFNKKPQQDLNHAIGPVFDDTRLSDDGQRFIGCCLQVDPEDRISAKSALRHEWFHRPQADANKFKAIDRRAYNGWRPRKALVPMAEEISETDVEGMLSEGLNERDASAHGQGKTEIMTERSAKNREAKNEGGGGNNAVGEDVLAKTLTLDDHDRDDLSRKRRCLGAKPSPEPTSG